MKKEKIDDVISKYKFSRGKKMRFKYCPTCGTQLSLREIGDEGLVPYCEKCKSPFWEMFSTCIICAVVNELKEVALLKQNYVSKAHYVCVAGFVQLGENAEETAMREIQEEIGLDVECLEYQRSYFYDKKEMLMLGYKATVKKSDFTLSSEVNDVKWVPYSVALEKLRVGSIGWQLVSEIINKDVKN